MTMSRETKKWFPIICGGGVSKPCESGVELGTVSKMVKIRAEMRWRWKIL
jgi:hypothetical protein